MENIPNKVASESSALIASASQASRFKERETKKADAVTKASEAVYFSPVIRIDAETSAAIIQYRDSETGVVENEYPSPRKVDNYKKAESKDSAVKAPLVEQKPIETIKPDLQEATSQRIDAEV